MSVRLPTQTPRGLARLALLKSRSTSKINEVESTSTWLVSGPAVSQDWIELYYNGTTPVDISGLKLLDNDNNNNTKYSIPAGIVLAAGAYLAITDAALTLLAIAAVWVTRSRNQSLAA